MSPFWVAWVNVVAGRPWRGSHGSARNRWLRRWARHVDPWRRRVRRRCPERTHATPALPAAWVNLTCLSIAVGLAGCGNEPPGPKRDDHLIAHSTKYHPDVNHRDLGQEPTTRPAPETDNRDPRLRIGKQALFINNEAITVRDVLEPIIDELRDKARLLERDDYIQFLRKTVIGEINRRISFRVLYQDAKQAFTDERLQKLIDKDADDLISRLILESYGGVEARYEAHLAEYGLTMADIKERAKRRTMGLSWLRRQYASHEHMSNRRELLDYYKRHLDDYTTPRTAKPFFIEIPFSTTVPAPKKAVSRAAARAAVTRAKQELDQGAEFADVARKHSKGPAASQGGAWPAISPGALVGKPLAKPGEVLFTLQPGQISDLIETDHAFFIVKCGRCTPRSILSFEEAQQDIRDKLQEKQYTQWSNRYVADLVAKARIPEKDLRAFATEVVIAAPLPQPKPPPGQDTPPDDRRDNVSRR